MKRTGPHYEAGQTKEIDILYDRISALREILGKEPTHLEISHFTSLTLNEVNVVLLRFDKDMKWKMTLKSIASEIGKSPERIRQMETRALRRLRNNVWNCEVSRYLPYRFKTN